MNNLFSKMLFTILGISIGMYVIGSGLAYAAAFLVASGGTGTTSVPVNQILTGNGTSAFNSTASTSTYPWGVNIATGCFAVNGSCIGSGGGGSGTMTSIGLGFGATNTVYAILATTTSATNGETSALTITNSGNTYTFTPSQSGTRTVQGGGSGAATFTTGILGASGTNNFFTTATSTIGGSGGITVTAGASVFAPGAITVACASCNLSSASVTSVGLSSTNSTLTVGSTPVTTSGTITADLNLAHTNTWTVLQNFYGNASTTGLSVSGKSFFGTSATTTIDTAGAITVSTTNTNTFPNASTTNLTVASTASSTDSIVSSLGTAAGTFVAANPQGQLIATTTPSGGSNAWTLLDSTTTSTDLLNLGGWSEVMIVLKGVTVVDSSNRVFTVSSDNGATFDSSTSDYFGGASCATGQAGVQIIATGSSAASYAWMIIENWNTTAPAKIVDSSMALSANAATNNTCAIATSTALNAVRLNRTPQAGTMYAYGR